MRPRSRPSWTYPLFTDTFKLQKRSVDFSGKQPPLERQVQPKKAPSESRIYPRDLEGAFFGCTCLSKGGCFPLKSTLLFCSLKLSVKIGSIHEFRLPGPIYFL